MSHNLRLTCSRTGDRCSLYQTPSVVTWDILEKRTRGERLDAYFNWAKKDTPLGAFLDHQIEILRFFFDHPDADWSSS